MPKHLIKHGNSLALVIDKAILDAMSIDATTPLEIKIDQNPLSLRVVRAGQGGVSSDRIADALAKGNQRFAKAMQKLAE